MSDSRGLSPHEICEQALKREANVRQAYVAEICGGNSDLQREVERLLFAQHQTLAAEAQPFRLLETDSFGPYRLLRKIGEGGMGIVYLAERSDSAYRKQVAVKIVKSGADSQTILHRFAQERQILAALDHPNIARFLDAGTTESGLPYFVMEYVEGVPMDQYCDSKSFHVRERLELFRTVCSAVYYAHQNLVVHRDLKPGHILVTSSGVPKLLDFGVARILTLSESARLTATGFQAMTPHYASPEQVLGDSITTATDVYSLGVVLYELLTGHLPYLIQTDKPAEMIRIISEELPANPSASVESERLQKLLKGDLDQIVMMAMRKEPQRRYPSVDQLSEDIRRHLENLPIRARKDTFRYRASKFIRRNRASVAVTAVAVIAIVVFAVMTLVIQWRANQQARLFQEFGQQMTQMESLMRYAYLLPLHNIESDKKQVTTYLDGIRSRMHTLGKLADGPGLFAIGRGYLSLHRYQDAYDNLTVAWNQYDYREPQVANALGLALAMLYRQKLQEAQQLTGKDFLEQRKRELEEKYRKPAVQFIEQGTTSSASEPPQYVDALLAFLSKHYAVALEKAEYAASNISWLYEARVLQGDILTAEGSDEETVGKLEHADELYKQAKDAYTKAAEKGQSDPQVYNRMCALQFALERRAMDEKGIIPQEIIADGIADCEKALAADSKNIDANLLSSAIYGLWAYELTVNGKDYKAAIQKTVEYARVVLQIDPDNALAYRSLGNAYFKLAYANIYKESDSRSMFDFAESNLAKASIRMPHDFDLVQLRGNNLVGRARLEAANGGDPRPTLEKAVALLQEALDLNPKYFKAHSNFGTAYLVKASYELDHGLDAMPSLQKGIALFNEAIKINPKYENTYQYAGVAYLMVADLEADRGKDPNDALDHAIEVYEKSLALDPQDAWSHLGVGVGYWHKAEQKERKNSDPTTELNSARAAFQKTVGFNKEVVECYAYSANVEMIAAEYAQKQNNTPLVFYQEARKFLDAGLKVNADCSECLESEARLYLLQARYHGLHHDSIKNDLAQGLSAADRALAKNPQLFKTHAVRGCLLLLRAQILSDKKMAREAQASFEHAFQIKSALKNEFGPYYEQAKHLQ